MSSKTVYLPFINIRLKIITWYTFYLLFHFEQSLTHFVSVKKNVTLYFTVSLVQSNYQVNYLVKAIVLTVHETNVTYHVTMLWNSLYLQFVIM